MSPSGIIKRTLGDIDLRNTYKLNLVTIKRCYEEEQNGEKVTEEHILGVPGSKTVIYDTDTIVVFGTIQDIERFMDINS